MAQGRRRQRFSPRELLTRKVSYAHQRAFFDRLTRRTETLGGATETIRAEVQKQLKEVSREFDLP